MKRLSFKAIILVLAGICALSCDLLISFEKSDDTSPEGSSPEGSTPEGNTPKPDNDEFVILFTNDFHSQIEPTDNGRGGAARLKALVDSVRRAEPVVLLADSGDLVQGTYYFSLLNGVVEMMILEELGYDIRTLGNHEFDKKMTGLGEMLAMSKVPVVTTNYDFSNTSLANYMKDSAILDAGSIKVGFLGLNVMLRNLVDPTACEGVEWQNAINVADEEAESLRAKGADIVIALSHLGYGRNDDRYYYDRGIAMNTRHIDMIIGGHSHTTLYEADYVTNLDGERIPIVQTGSKGANIGYAKIKMDKEGKPSFTYRLIPVNDRLDDRIDQAFADRIGVYSATVSEKMNEKLGYCPYALNKGYPESRLGNLTADGMIWMAKEYQNVDADVSLYNNGGIRSNISQGDLTLGDIYAVYPFDNALTTLTMKGSDLKVLFSHVAASGGMPVNAAVRLVIGSDYSVKSLTLDGQPIDDDRTYTIATIDYLANTGEYGLDKYITRRDSPEYVRDYFGEYYRQLAEENGGQIYGYLDGRVRME